MCNLINRTNVSSKTKGNFNCCDDFLVLVVTCYTLAVAMEYLEVNSFEEYPSEAVVPDVHELWALTADQRQNWMNSICLEIVDKFIPFQFNTVTTPQSDQVTFVYLFV